MKKILSLILAVSMCLSISVGIFAAENNETVLYKETFDSFGVDSKGPTNVTINTDGFAKITDNGKGGKALAYDLNLTAGALVIPIASTSSKVHVSAQLKIYDRLATASLFKFADANGDAFDTIKINNGDTTVGNGKIINKIPMRKWVQLDVVYNVTNRTYDVFIDGVRYVKNMLTFSTAQAPTSVSFDFENTSAVTVVYFDNIVVSETNDNINSVTKYQKGNDGATIKGTDTTIVDGGLPEVFLFDSFDGGTAGSCETAFTVFNNKVGFQGMTSTAKGGMDGYFCIDSDRDGVLREAYSTLQYTIKPLDVKNFVIDFQLNMRDCEDNARPISIYDKLTGKYFNMLHMDADKTMTSGGRVVSGHKMGQWVRYSFVVDMNKHLYDLYVDGNLEHEGISIPAYFTEIPYFRCAITRGEMWIDNLSTYAGRELLPDTQLNRKSMMRFNQSRFDDINTNVLEFLGEMSVVTPEMQVVYHDGKKIKYGKHSHQSQGSDMFSLNTLAEGFGFTVSYNANGTAVVNGNATITVGSNSAYVNGKEVKLAAPVEKNGDGDFYVPVDTFLRQVIGKYTYTDSTYGLIFVDEKPISIAAGDLSNHQLMLGTLNYVVYDEATPEEIAKIIKERWPNKAHPRMSLTEESLQRVRDYVDKDDFMNTAFKLVKRFCDNALTGGPVKYSKVDGTHGITSARLIENRVMSLAWMYNYTKDEKYAEKAWEQLELLCTGFPTWAAAENPLNNGAVTLAAAIGYDWLYNWMNDDQRKLLRDNIVEKTLWNFAIDYAGIAQDRGFRYINGEMNFNAVGQGPALMAALAIADEEEYEQIASYVIANAHRGLRYMFHNIRVEDGASSESTSYWSYQHIYLSKAVDALQTTMGTDFGLFDTKGSDNAANFYLVNQGPAGTYTFHDAGGTRNWSTRADAFGELADMVFLYAKQYNDPAAAASLKKMGETRGMTDLQHPNLLVWYDPEFSNAESGSLFNDNYIKGDYVELVSLSGASLDDNRAYMVYNAGRNNGSHSHRDNGAFTFHGNETIWFDDLGAEDYEAQPLGADFRHYSEAHNMYVINPRAGYEGSKTTAVARTAERQLGTQEAYTTINLSDTYEEDVTQAMRGYKLTDNRTSFVVRDEFTLKKYSKVYWRAHTMQNVEIIDKNTAILSSGKERLHVRIDTNAPSYELVAEDVVPFETTDNPPEARNHNLWKRLAVNIEAGGSIYVNMKCTPLYEDGQTINEHNIPISQWTLNETGDIPYLSSYSVNGVNDSEFIKYNTNINVYVTDGKVPEFSAVADDRYNVEYKKPATIFERGLVKVTEKANPKNYTYYKVNFIPKAEVKNDSNKGYNISKITRTYRNAYENDGLYSKDVTYTADVTNILTDGKFDAFSSVGHLNTIYDIDLGQVNYVTNLNMALSGLDEIYMMNIAYSEDGINYKTIYNVRSLDGVENMLKYNLGGVNARYLRIVANGGLTTTAFKLNEVSAD